MGKTLRFAEPTYLTCLLQLEYFEFVLNPYFTADARESLKSLQGVLLEKATESMSEAAENPGHHRRPTRGSEDALADERQQGMGVSPDDLIVRDNIGLFMFYLLGEQGCVFLWVLIMFHAANLYFFSQSSMELFM